RAAAALADRSRLVPVQVVPRDKRKIPAMDGTCVPSLDSCSEDPCYRALPLPSAGVVGALDAARMSLLEVKGSPSIEEISAARAKPCQRMDATTWAWAVR